MDKDKPDNQLGFSMDGGEDLAKNINQPGD